MNRSIAKIGAAGTAVMVVLFMIFMPISKFLSYLVCIFLALGYLLMAVGFYQESAEERKTAAMVGVIFACIYGVLILLVYFAQITAVRNDSLSDEAMRILDFSRGGLLFDYDLLGYGMMALPTFFLGLTIRPKHPRDKWLKYLMMIHGVFFLSCFILPITGLLGAGMADGSDSLGGVIALECWCVYFLPVSILAAVHFQKS